MNFLIECLTNKFIYSALFFIFTIGVFISLFSTNLIKKLVGLSIIQNSIILIYISFGFVSNGAPPVLESLSKRKENIIAPLPQVLMLTAIVVGLGTFSVGLSVITRIKREFGTIDTNKLNGS